MERKLTRRKNFTSPVSPKAHRKSFDGKIGEEYMIFRKAIPHFDAFQKRIGAAVSEHTVSPQHFSIIELGCGPGTTTKELLCMNPNASLVRAIDNSDVMLKQARKCLFPYIREGSIELIQADAMDYLREVPTGSVDSIASGWMIHNFTPDVRIQLQKEIYRVLKKGGVFVNGDKYANDDLLIHKQQYEWTWSRMRHTFIHENKAYLWEEWDNHMRVDDSPGRRMYEGISMEQLRELGFRRTEQVWRRIMEAVVVAIK